MKPHYLILLWGALLATSAFSTEEMSAERKAQEQLPQSRDGIWKTFGQCKVHYDGRKFTYSINFTDEVKAMEGKKITVTGFILPLDPTEKFSHYLLSKRTPTCPFCPPGEPNEVIEIFSKKPIKWASYQVKVTGTLAFTNNPELGLFFQMKDGEIIDFR